MNFKIKKISDTERFARILDKCSGDVRIRTAEGDDLSLKSKLSQLISLNVILNGATTLNDTELVVEKQEDVALLMEYIASC